MSGPKVIRIVTREEALAVCRPDVERLDAILAEWERVLARNDILDEKEVRHYRARRQQIHALLDADQFIQVQKQAPALAETLRLDLERKLDVKFEAEMAARQSRQHLKSTAAALLQEFTHRPDALPADVREALTAGHDDTDDAARNLESAIAKAFVCLATSRKPEGPTERQLELASQLDDGSKRESLDDWLGRNGAPTDQTTSPAVRAIERQIRLLAALGDHSSVEAFQVRLEALLQEVDPSRRRLQTDALALEVAAEVKQLRALGDLRREAHALRTPLESNAISAETQAELDRLNTCLVSRDLAGAQSHMAALRAEVDRQVALRAATARRQALLDGLKELGYDVKEGMATAWVRDGRLIVKNQALPGYGIELGGRAEAGQVQVRVVTGSDSNTGMSEREAETTWCGDVDALKAHLSKQGVDIAVERATPAGVQAVKRIDWPASEAYYEAIEEVGLRELGGG